MFEKLKQMLNPKMIRDPLIGEWSSNIEKGATQSAGFKLLFSEDEEGVWSGWDDTEDDPYMFKTELMWRRKNNDTILIRQRVIEPWIEVQYVSEVFTLVDGRASIKIYEPKNHSVKHGLEGFWNCTNALYKLV